MSEYHPFTFQFLEFVFFFWCVVVECEDPPPCSWVFLFVLFRCLGRHEKILFLFCDVIIIFRTFFEFEFEFKFLLRIVLKFYFSWFDMAYYSGYKKRGYFGRGYKGYNWKRKKLTPSRAFKRSAANMTQNGLFNVNCVVPVVLNPASMLVNGAASNYMGAFSVLDVPGTIYTSAMHSALKKVFDQYRIEKVTVKIAMG